MRCPNLEYGWITQEFELSDVKLHSDVFLIQLNEADDWEARRPYMLFDELEDNPKLKAEFTTAYENIGEISYSKPQRRFWAKAIVTETLPSWMLYGIPEDKKHNDLPQKPTFQSLSLAIREIEFVDPTKSSKFGFIGCIAPEADTGFDGYALAEVYIPSNAFDDIVQLSNQPEVTFTVSLNLKCWHCERAYRTYLIYLDEAEKGYAELADFSVIKTFPNQPSDKPHEDEEN